MSHTDTPTCKDDQAIAGFRVAEDTSSQQHVLVGKGVFLVSPVQRPTETIQLVVGRLTHHLAFTHTNEHGQTKNTQTHKCKLDAISQTSTKSNYSARFIFPAV